MDLRDLKFDKRNYRRHNDRNKELIKKSIEEVGFGRSIVIDAENEIVCGNGVVSQADKNTKIKVIETDGSELVVIKRTDLKTSDAKRKQLAVMDNSASDTSDFDMELLQEDFSVDDLNDWGIEFVDEDFEKSGIEDSKYNHKIDTPIYEIKGENPDITELYNLQKYNELINIIENSDIQDKLKEMLKITATRLIEFNYSKIAEFYAHQNKDVQELMEKQALVIIDFDKAVENGYVELNKFINDVFLGEHDIEE